MPGWGLVIEENRGYGRHARTWPVDVLGHVEGTREEALAALRLRAERFAPAPGPTHGWDAQVPEVPSWSGRDDLPLRRISA
ncbi:hypothetical protein [Streptomyces atroolivaceus]|uniref:hypothetical protein n=1 Tax=Streptomyces atroolivaceus TaxID=66869 RepID=UPI00202473E8|nr:hypothetical protein [Streptomyces atroolivaceus]